VSNFFGLGGHTGGETCLPIPNRTRLPPRADGTASARAWESRSPPGFLFFLIVGTPKKEERLKKVDFFEHQFFITDKIFTPRPETEILVEVAVDYLKDYFYSPNFKRKEVFCVADAGTGSGCIIISIFKKLEKILKAFEIRHSFVGTDIDKDALKLAKYNSKIIGANVSFICGDLLAPIKKADFVVSNPPYVSLKVKDKIKVNDPPHTIFGGEIGCEKILEIIKQASFILPSGGFIFLEVGYDDLKFFGLPELGKIYKEKIFSFAEKMKFKIFPPIKDYNKIERIVVMQKM
jgi:HemK-like putative methylase